LSRPLITALINSYNYGQFVEEAIDSVLAQDYPNERVEILVVDDGSTDDTAERLKKYGTRIKYLQKANGGQASAFNFGFERAKGEIIAFLDADDYWLPEKLSRVADAFDEYPAAGLVYHRRIEVNAVTGKSAAGEFAKSSGYLPDSLKSMLDYRVAPTSALSFSRKALAQMLPMPEWIRLQADAYMALLAVFVAPVAAVDDVLSVYRLHGKNLYATGSREPSQMAEHIEMRKKIVSASLEWLAEHGYNLRQANTEAFFEQLHLALASDEFEVKAPTRTEFFKHMKRRNKLYAHQCGWKLRVMNWFNALAAPLVGYQRFEGVYKTELRVISSLQHFRSGHA
jgi:glycosyltransferase involved in cell wall biosynthesis